jgi:hypothetical protein
MAWCFPFPERYSATKGKNLTAGFSVMKGVNQGTRLVLKFIKKTLVLFNNYYILSCKMRQLFILYIA